MNKYRDSGTVFHFSVISTLVFVAFAQTLSESGEAGETDENHIGVHGSSALEKGPQENPQMNTAFVNSQEIGIPDIEKLFFEFKITRGKLKKDIHLRGKIPKTCGEFIGLAANCDSSKNIVTFDITERKPAGFDCLTKNRERCLNPSLEKCISLDDLAKGEKPSATIIQPVFKKKDSKAGKNSCAHINIKSVQIKFTQTFFISNNSAKTEGEFCPTCNQKEPLDGLRNQIQQVQAITDKASSEQSGHGSHGTSPGASLKETSESVDGSHSSHSKMDKVSPAGGGMNMEKGMNHRNGMSASAMGNMNPMRNGPSPLMGGMSRMDNMPIGPSMYGPVGMPSFPAMGMAAPYYSSMNGLMGMNSGSMFGTQASPYGWWGTNPYAPPNPMTNGVNRYDPFGPMNQMARLNDPYAQMYQITGPSPLGTYSNYPPPYSMQTLGPTNPYANSFGSKLTFPYSYLRGNLFSP